MAFVYLLGLATLAAGWRLWYLDWRGATVRERAVNWPVATGEITRSELRKTGRARPLYRAKIHYRYSVKGRDYAGRRVSPGGDLAGPRDQARARLAAYPSGATVEVRYNPANPKEAYLEWDSAHGRSAMPLAVVLMVGGAVLSFGLFMAQ